MTNFWTPRALYGPLWYWKSKIKGSESPISLHKFILPENAFIFDLSDVEMPFKCRNIELRGQKPQIFNLKSGIKFWKVLQTSQLLVKNCIFISSCWQYTQNIHRCFYFSFIVDFMSRNGHFLRFFRFLACFLRGEGSKKFFW